MVFKIGIILRILDKATLKERCNISQLAHVLTFYCYCAPFDLYCNAGDWTIKTHNKSDLYFFHNLDTILSKCLILKYFFLRSHFVRASLALRPSVRFDSENILLPGVGRPTQLLRSWSSTSARTVALWTIYYRIRMIITPVQDCTI